MSNFNHESKEISTDWLTGQLVSNGYLESGEVSNVTQQRSPFMNRGESPSAIFFMIDIEYSAASKGEMPDHCMMKAGKPSHYERNLREFEFYQMMGQEPPNEALVACYALDHDPDSQSTAILIEDKGGSKHMTAYPVPPEIDACERAVQVLAGFHGKWWQSPKFTEPQFDPWTAEKVDRMCTSVFFPAADRFIGDLSDRLSSSRRKIIERFVDRFPNLLKQQLRDSDTLTLTHQDAHFWNFLIPEDPNQQTVLIDWQMWDVDLAVKDLSYMIALHWFPERRSRYERHLLDIYLAELHRNEIEYTRGSLLADYRFSVLRELATPILGHAWGVPADIWWNHLERVFLSIDDWDALALLD